MPNVTFEEVYANTYIRESVEIIVSNTVRKYPMAETYADDIRQQLLIALNNAAVNFDPLLGTLETYMRRALDRRIKWFMRNFFSRRRCFNRVSVSLDLLIERHEFDVAYDNPVIRQDMAMDVHSVIATLTIEQQEICTEILNGERWAAIAKKKNYSRCDFFRRFILPIRAAFAKENLQNYLNS